MFGDIEVTKQEESKMAECYFCGENNANWCKICQAAFCIVDHEEHEESFRQTEYLSWHQYYDMEFLGVWSK